MCKLRQQLYWARQVWYLLCITLYAFYTGVGAVANSSECDVFGTCSQICTDTQNGSYECSCLEGLRLEQDNKTCSLIDPQWKLVYADQEGIRCISKLSNGAEQITNLTNEKWKPLGVTFDARSNVVYLADIRFGWQAIYTINMGSKFETKREKIGDTHGLEKLESIAFDWITGNIYYTAPRDYHIGVCRNDKDECVVVVYSHRPWDMALHPNQGLMFWTEQGEGTSNSIFRAGMDGSFVLEIISMDSPLAVIVVDQGNSRLFWAHRWLDRLESSRFDGSDRRVVISSGIGFTHSIDILGDRVFWVDEKFPYIKSANMYNGSNVVSHKPEVKNWVVDLALMHIAKQPILRSNPCQRDEKCSHICTLTPMATEIKCLCPRGMMLGNDNRTCVGVAAVANSSECDVFGTCSQICTDTQNGSYECSCLEGLQLGQDNRTCTLIDPQWKLVYAEDECIRCISKMSNGTEQITNLTNGEGIPVGVTYDARSNVVYWTDATSGSEAIYRINMSNKSETKVETVANIGLHQPESIAFDWITGNIYFIDSTAGHIGVCNNDKDECVVVVKTNTACNLALHPNQGLMFWVDCKGAGIFSAGMDGIFIREILPAPVFVSPNGLVVDQGSSRIFWYNIWPHELESARLDGSDRRVISDLPENSKVIDVLGDRIFWLYGEEEFINEIKSIDKYNGLNVVTHEAEIDWRVRGLTVMHISNQPILRSNPCQRADECSHICTLSPIATEIKCFCPVGMILGNDARTCVALQNVTKLVVAFKNTIQLMRFNAIGKNVIESISLPTLKSISDIVYNPTNHTLILSDSGTKKIYEYGLNSKQLSVLVNSHLDMVIGMDIDAVGENLYWIDSGKKTIEAMALRTSARTVILTDMEHAFEILVVSKMGSLFIAKKDENEDVIVYNVFLNGSNTTVFQTHTKPITMAHDDNSDNIIWAEKVSGKVESISTDGSSRSTLLRLSQNVTSDVVIYEGQVFWVDILNQELKYMEIIADEYEEHRSVGIELPSLNEHSSPSNMGGDFPVKMAKVDRNMLYLEELVLKHECSRENPRRKQCSHMCLLTGEEFVGECRCPTGLTLDEDGVTCKEVEAAGSGMHDDGGDELTLFYIIYESLLSISPF